MRAYKNADGTYDVYNVEPTVITAEEYAIIEHGEELKARKEALLKELAEIERELVPVNATVASPTAVTESSPTVQNDSDENPVIKKRW